MMIQQRDKNQELVVWKMKILKYNKHQVNNILRISAITEKGLIIKFSNIIELLKKEFL